MLIPSCTQMGVRAIEPAPSESPRHAIHLCTVPRSPGLPCGRCALPRRDVARASSALPSAHASSGLVVLAPRLALPCTKVLRRAVGLYARLKIFRWVIERQFSHALSPPARATGGDSPSDLPTTTQPKNSQRRCRGALVPEFLSLFVSYWLLRSMGNLTRFLMRLARFRLSPRAVSLVLQWRIRPRILPGLV
jgi:hypothetical protein